MSVKGVGVVTDVERLELLRDEVVGRLDGASDRDVAAMGRLLIEVQEAIAAAGKGVSDGTSIVDELKARRTAKQSGAAVSRRAKAG